MKNDHPLKRFFTERTVILLIRWWIAGAVYFFIGWGTQVGQGSLISFVMRLGIVLGLMNMIFVNPAIRMMFNVAPKFIPGTRTVMQRISDYLVEFIKSIFIVLMVALIYIVINRVLITLLGLPSDAVPLPGEPILFGAFYVFVFVLLAAVTDRVKRMISSGKA